MLRQPTGIKQFFVIGVLLSTFFNLYGHPYHIVRVDLRYNTETSMVEGACKVFIEDAEIYLYETYGVQVDIAKSSDSTLASFILPHLKTGIHLGKKFRPNWVGYELDSPHVWFYFQAPFAKTPFAENLPRINLFCDKNGEMSFLVYLYEDEQLVQSARSTCASRL